MPRRASHVTSSMTFDIGLPRSAQLLIICFGPTEPLNEHPQPHFQHEKKSIIQLSCWYLLISADICWQCKYILCVSMCFDALGSLGVFLFQLLRCKVEARACSFWNPRNQCSTGREGTGPWLTLFHLCFRWETTDWRQNTSATWDWILDTFHFTSWFVRFYTNRSIACITLHN